MDLAAALLLSFFMLVFCVLKNIFVAYPLFISLLLFIFICYRRGFRLKELVNMAYRGGKKSLIVLKIFILIGAITSIWMASGTVPAIVYYGIKFINPNYFILYAFLISCIVSFLIGTSFGTVSTVGIAFMVMARGGGINLNAVAGAIIAGAYFGDRCSPMSSSAVLVAHLTETELYKNIRNMAKTALLPFLLSVVFYILLSVKMPVNISGSSMSADITSVFKINMLVLLPAASILILSLFKVNVRLSMGISIFLAAVISISVQHKAVLDVIRYIFLGYEIDGNTPLKDIMKGGGLLSMLKVAVVVFISSAFSGVFEGTNILSFMEELTKKTKTRSGLLLQTAFMSIASAAFGCSQAIAIILTHQLVKKAYDDMKRDKYESAADIENTAVVLSPLIPWNIAGLVPASMLMVSPEFIPYAFYLYLLPVCNFAYLKIKEMRLK